MVLSGLSELPGACVAPWVRFIQAWAGAAATLDPATSPKALLVPLQSLEAAGQFRADTFLAVSWFWGWVSSAEVALLARSVCRERGLSPMETLWVQSVYVGLAGGDLECLMWLVDRAIPPPEESGLLAHLVAYAEERRWSEQSLNGEERREASGAFGTLAPPEHLRALWSLGAVDADDGHLAIHAAWLAAGGRTQSLRHRIWAAQASTLLPLMDGWRLSVCQELGRVYREWAGFCAESIGEMETNKELHSAEFAVIERFLESRRLRPRPDWEKRRRARSLRCLRNKLAHYVPLSWEDFQAVCRDLR
jgi:hypothetical protein